MPSLPIYSPFKIALQFLQLKQLMCHCRSSAISACPSFSWSPHPAHAFGSYGPSIDWPRALVPFWLCWCAVARVGLLVISLANGWLCCCSDVVEWILLFAGIATQFSQITSLPVLVTYIFERKIRVKIAIWLCIMLTPYTHFVARLKRLTASAACKALLMVRIAHGWNHFAFDI